MKRFLLFLLFLLQSSTTLWAQNENSVLWKIENRDKASYILGTFCNSCINEVLNITPLDSILSKIDVCVFEYPFTDPMFNLKTTKSLFNERFEEYNEVFNKKQFRMLNKAVKSNREVSLYKYDEFEPWVTLEILKAKSSHTNNQKDIVEYVTKEVGKTASIKDFYDWKLNFNLSKNKTIDEQYEEYLKFKLNKKSRQENYRSNKKLYREERIDEIDQLCNCQEQKNLSYLENVWIPKIKGFLQDKQESVLFVLPVYSLGKNTGIIELLRKNGYVLKPL